MASCEHMEYLAAQPLWALLLAFLGLLVAARFAFGTARFIYAAFLRPGKPLRRRYGTWAAVTGGTDGIGRAIAFRLAAAGLNLVIVGRNPEKLADTAQSIASKYPKSVVETVVIDFAGETLAEDVEKFRSAIKDKDLGILVNNAGVSYPYARYFHEVDDDLLKRLIKVNVEAVTRITHVVLPGMVERKRGAVVNIGSGAASVIPSDPLYSVYAATKAYVDQFSRCLYVEYKNKGIDVQCQAPLYVATKMASIKKSSFMVPSAETYARAAVRYIGYEPRCAPYWPHHVLWCLISIIPESVVDSIRLKMCIGIRKRGMAKDAKKKSQ